MPKSTHRTKITKISDLNTLTRAQKIFERGLSNPNSDYKKVLSNRNQIDVNYKKFKTLKRLKIYSLKKSLNNFKTKKLYFQPLKTFYNSYKFLIFNKFILFSINLLKKLTSLKTVYNEQKLVFKYFLLLCYIILKNLKYFFNKTIRICTFFLKKTIKNLTYFNHSLNSRYLNKLGFSNIYFKLLVIFYNLENSIFNFYINSESYLYKQLSQFETNKKIQKLYKTVKTYFSKINERIAIISLDLLSFDKKQLKSILDRLYLIIGIYLVPFVFLASQALVPSIDEYEYIIVNPISSFIFSKIPFLIDLIKLIRPLITNPMLLFWVPLVYYITFTSGYRALKIPYNIAFNGTIASIFLIINYSCVLMQFMLKLGYESLKMIKDIFFTSYLIKHLYRNKNKERDEAIKVFTNLVGKYDLELRKNYYDFLLLINHRVFSHLALISLVALVYNCMYYIIRNRNPEIILVTKTALATIKNPQGED